MSLPFVKMHGLGNDFIVVDLRESGEPLPPDRVVELCDRHRGVGADGVLAILPSAQAPLAMHVTNSDGSIAEMCGNGLRCVVRYAVDRKLLDPAGGRIETGRGVLECFVEADGQVRVDMGRPEVREEPLMLIEVDGEKLPAWIVSMGNPHAITFLAESANPVEWALREGPAMERLPVFPHRTNVEFAVVHGTDINLAVWERGAGLTQACGTGACATAVAAMVTGLVPEGALTHITLPGGVLRVQVETDLSRVWMTGPAVEVFSGRIG